MRLMGKRQLGQLEPSELVVSVLIADLGAHPLQDTGIPMVYGLVSIVTIFCLELLFAGAALRSVRLRTILWGKPCFLIRGGRIEQKEMGQNRFTLDELTEELRRQGVTDIKSVEYAVLETDGTLSVLLKKCAQPATAGQLMSSEDESGYPMIIIDDGRILEENLHICGYDTKWLTAQLKQRGIQDPQEVYLMMADQKGCIYFAAKEESE